MALTPIHNNGKPKGSNGPFGKPAPKGVTPKPAGKPRGGKGLTANSNLKGGAA